MPRSSTTSNPADEAVLADIAAQEAAGGDPFGDDEPLVAESIEDQAKKAAAANSTEADDDDDVTPVEAKQAEPEEEKPAEEPLDTEALEAIAKDDEPEPSATVTQPEPPRFKVAAPDALQTERAALHGEKAVALKQMMEGVIDPAAYAEIEARVTDRLGQLLVQNALAEANAQTTAAVEGQALLALMAQAKKSGEIDYGTDVKAQKQFDTMLNGMLADPDNAKRPYSDVLADTHAAVLALRGVTKAAAPVAPPAPVKPPARVPEKPPLTLRGLPNASTPNTGGTVLDAMGRLRGADYQAAFAKLTPAQQAALVDE